MEAELSACVRLYPEARVGAECMAGSSAKRYYCCWHLDLARCSFLHLLLPSPYFSLHAQNPPTSSAVHYYIFTVFCFSVYLIFFLKWGIVNLPVVMKSISVSSGVLEGPNLLWYSNISSGISCLFPVRGRKNLLLLVSERETWGFPFSQLNCCRINFRLITIALSPLSNCR